MFNIYYLFYWELNPNNIGRREVRNDSLQLRKQHVSYDQPQYKQQRDAFHLPAITNNERRLFFKLTFAISSA